MSSIAYLVWLDGDEGIRSPLLAVGLAEPTFSADAGKPGQWFASTLPLEGVENEHRAEYQNKAKGLLHRLAAGAGLAPVVFEERFRVRLRDPAPLCLVADTCAILNGHLWHALAAREQRPLHLVVPDQVFMEVQRQRERTAAEKPDDSPWARYLRRREAASLLARSSRALRRARASGHIVHYARPPEPMVRYFGSALGRTEAVASDASSVGPNFHRDRLILEALRQQRMLLSSLQVWLVTGDARLAGQAHLEGFRVGLGWLPPPDEPMILTSPRIDPDTFATNHLPFEDFLDDLVWSFGRVVVQKHGEKTGDVYELPGNVRDRALLELADQPRIRSTSQLDLGVRLWPFDQLASGDLRDGPVRPPGAANLINGLLSPGTDEKVNRYLRALGWLQENVDQRTARGEGLVNRLTEVHQDDVAAWHAWLQDVAADVRNLKPIALFLEALHGERGTTANNLSKKAKIARASVEAMARLCNAFGIALRIDGKVWHVDQRERRAAADALFELVNEAVGNGGAAVPLTEVFLRLTATSPMSFPDFRLAVVDLLETGRVDVGGSAPASASNSSARASLSALDITSVPVDYLSIDLAAGDFVVPAQSSQIIRVPRP